MIMHVLADRFRGEPRDASGREKGDEESTNLGATSRFMYARSVYVACDSLLQHQFSR